MCKNKTASRKKPFFIRLFSVLNDVFYSLSDILHCVSNGICHLFYCVFTRKNYIQILTAASALLAACDVIQTIIIKFCAVKTHSALVILLLNQDNNSDSCCNSCCADNCDQFPIFHSFPHFSAEYIV